VLRIVTPLATLPLVLLALSEPGDTEADGAPSCLDGPAGRRYTLAGNGHDDTYTVQVVCADGTLSPCGETEPETTAARADHGTDADRPVDIGSC